MRAILFVALFSSSIFAKDIWDDIVISSSSASVPSSSVLQTPPAGIQTPKTLASSSSVNASPASSSSLMGMAPASARSMPRGFVVEQKSFAQISSLVASSSSQLVQLSTSSVIKSVQPNVAVIDFTGDTTVSADQLKFIAGTFIADLIGTQKFAVLDRGKMNFILNEQGFEQSGACNTSTCKMKMGQLLGVEYLIAGSLVRFGHEYAFSLEYVNVGSGQIEKTVQLAQKGELEGVYKDLCMQAARKLAGLDSVVVTPLAPLSSSSITPAAELLGLSSSSSVVASSSSARSRRELLGPVKVSRVNAIDEMKGSYKSPRKALFLSLVLPGAGQLYVGGSTANYARGAFYFATELALGGLWYHYSVTRYDQQVSRYEAFARAHYSIGKYEDQIYSLYNQLSDDKHTAFKDQYLSDRQEYCGAIYNDPNTNKCSDIATADAHRGLFPKDSLIKTSGTFYNPSVLYRIVGGDTYVMGWDDVTNVRSSVDISTDLDNSKKDTLGVSSNLVVYKGMRKTANRYAGYQAYFLGGILLNHIISAVDATVAAYSHNQGLYEEKVSWVDHLRFDSSVQWIGDWSTQVQARLEF